MPVEGVLARQHQQPADRLGEAVLLGWWRSRAAQRGTGGERTGEECAARENSGLGHRLTLSQLGPGSPYEAAFTSNRVRLLHFNAALGPLDYRVPEGMEVEPGSVVVAPLGPRQIVGIVWEQERLPTNPVPDAKLRPLLAELPVPRLRPELQAADRMDRRLLLRIAGFGRADGAVERRRAARAFDDDRIPPDGGHARADDAAAPRGDRGARRRAGDLARAGRHCRRQRRRAARSGQPGCARTSSGRLRPALPARLGRLRAAGADGRAGGGGGAAGLGLAQRELRAVPAGRGDRLRQDRSLFRGDCGKSSGKGGKRLSSFPKSR